MIFGKSKLEFKVGVFVFIGLIILAAFVLMIGKFKTWSSGYRVNIVFNFVNGIKMGAPVRFAGVDVGEVKSVDILPSPKDTDPRVKVVSWVKRDVNIPADSTVWVNTLGLLGEKYIEIMPGNDYARLITENETLIGTDPMSMQEVGVLAKKIVTDLDESVVKMTNKEGTIGRLLYDDEVYKEVVGVMKNAGAVSKNLEEMTADLKAHPWKLFLKGKEDTHKK